MRKNDYYSNSKDYLNRWVISYADFVTMLLALFMVMFAVSGNNSTEISNVIKKQFNITADKNITVIENQEKPKIQEIKTDKNEELYQNLKQKFDKDTSLSVVKENRGIIIRINDTMLFDEGSAIIKSGAKSVLTKIASELNDIDNPILIEGHTDSIPIKNEKYPSNWELSTARATNIIKYLTENKLLNPRRLSAVGYGEYMPIATNETKDGRAKNRRVDIIVLSNNK